MKLSCEFIWNSPKLPPECNPFFNYSPPLNEIFSGQKCWLLWFEIGAERWVFIWYACETHRNRATATVLATSWKQCNLIFWVLWTTTGWAISLFLALVIYIMCCTATCSMYILPDDDDGDDDDNTARKWTSEQRRKHRCSGITMQIDCILCVSTSFIIPQKARWARRRHEWWEEAKNGKRHRQSVLSVGRALAILKYSCIYNNSLE